MASSQLVALEQHLSDFDTGFIVRGKEFNQLIKDDHLKALAYVLLASAALESYVEDRCLAIATKGCDLIGKGMASSTGRSILVWYISKKWARPIPIHPNDPIENIDVVHEALTAYKNMVKATHGMDGNDFRKLVYPLGLRSNQVPDSLIDFLDSLSQKRNPAAHTYRNRAKSLAMPEAESRLIDQILSSLRLVDAALDNVVDAYPVNHL
ncbi:hypothetical protein ADILRU_0907 [Leifsonia rubra CMS 76R]|nr:hypothetical protein ADILRU_0907 [Leifsonia rubra CMS 76R]